MTAEEEKGKLWYIKYPIKGRAAQARQRQRRV